MLTPFFGSSRAKVCRKSLVRLRREQPGSSRDNDREPGGLG
jgi:hypothetical protein